jgi:hypothetical protein
MNQSINPSMNPSMNNLNPNGKTLLLLSFALICVSFMWVLGSGGMVNGKSIGTLRHKLLNQLHSQSSISEQQCPRIQIIMHYCPPS